MTRRKFFFVDRSTKQLYTSPEFNRSIDEYKARGTYLDAWDISASELKKLFQVNSLDAFSKACEVAQSHYRSFLGCCTYLPAVEVSSDQLSGQRLKTSLS